MTETQRFILVMSLVVMVFVGLIVMGMTSQPGYTLVTLNGVECIVFDDAPNNGGETTELDRLRCPSDQEKLP